MQKMDKKVVWGIGAVVLIIIIALIVMMMGKKNNTADNAQTTPPPPPAVTPAAGNPPPPSAEMSYTDAVKKYGQNRIQFDAACQTHPNQVTFKAGTTVMFDNRANIAHTITFGAAKYTIAKEGYIFITMTAAKYPTTIQVDCDKSQNVATILIQK